MQQLETIFGELGISQYLSSFIDQGFDSWDTVLDITETDLDVLGVKLGHRRKLQRRIANTRGVSHDISLGSAKRPHVEEARPQDSQRPEAPKFEARENGNAVIPKRKYRRHPKPDDNAPERPPSAYVLFSNKMREDLKGRNLTFTEIAKLVGENWQSLSTPEKEPFESQAQALKDTFQTNQAEYRKTPEYKKYMAYLQEFKAKHAPSSQDKEASKRIKLSESGGMSGSSANATPNRTSRSGSGSSHRGSEPPPSRQQRLGSIVSAVESQDSAAMTPAPYHNPLDDVVDSPKTVTTEHHSEGSPTFSRSPTESTAFASRREPNWAEDQRMELRMEQPAVLRHLPSFSDVFESPGMLPSMAPSTDVNGYPFPRTHTSPGPGPPPGLVNGDNRPPPFRKEQSSGGSTSSSASSFIYPRTPIESSLPIHALLASKPGNTFEPNPHQQQPVFQPRLPPSIEQQHAYAAHQPPNGMGPPMMNGYHRESPVPSSHTPVAHSNGIEPGAGYGVPPAAQHHNPSHDRDKKPDTRLDGMSALLKAGEMVDRRAQ